MEHTARLFYLISPAYASLQTGFVWIVKHIELATIYRRCVLEAGPVYHQREQNKLITLYLFFFFIELTS